MDKMPLPNSNKVLTERRIRKGSRWTAQELAGLLLALLIGFGIGFIVANMI